MAEFVASLVALVGAGIQTAAALDKLIKGLRSAPEEFLALANEVSAINQVIDRASNILCEHRTRLTGKSLAIEAHPINFGQIIGRANEIYVQIKSSVDSLNPEEKKGQWKHTSRLVWLRRKEQLLKLQSGLKECRQEITAFVGIENLRLTSQMAVQINEIHSMWKAGSETTLTTSTNSPNDPDFVKNNDKSNSLRTQNFLSLSTTHSFNTPSCGFSCGCVCHRQLCSYYDAGLLGSLFLAPELPFFASSSCTERKCRGKATSNVRFTYYFPSWYLRKAITILYNGNGPQFSVRFANIIPENHDLFGCAKTGDVKKLKLLLTSGQSSPTDIDHDGDGLLICTLELKEFSLEMCNFVYSLPGVDPLATNRFGQSFVSIAWQLILSMEPETRHTDPLASWLVSVITKYDYFEERQFKTLHKIVTDCSTIPLLSQLDTSTAEIDDPDASGWTPLMWATFRHNAKAMQNLLDYEADANLLNKEGQHALHLGAWSWNPKKTDISLEVAAWERLVSKIPEVDLIDRYKWTPLMYASRTARNVPLLEALIDAGADVNLPGHAGITPLHWAAQVDRCDAVKYLVQVGAKLDAVTLEDKTPLHLAASNNAHGSLQALLDLGAGAAEVLCNGRAESLLFEAAHSADLKTLTLLAQADLPEVDLASVKDEDGRTLQEAFDESRAESLDAEVAAAWELFIESLSVLWHDAVDGEPSFQAGVQTADEHLKVEKIAYE